MTAWKPPRFDAPPVANERGRVAAGAAYRRRLRAILSRRRASRRPARDRDIGPAIGRPTLLDLPGSPAALGVGALWYKDESSALRPRQLQGARRRLCGLSPSRRTPSKQRPGRRPSCRRDLMAGAHRDIARDADGRDRDRWQSWTLRRLGRVAVRLPLRHLHPRDGQRGPQGGDREIRRRGASHRRQLRRFRAPGAPPTRRPTAGR